MTDNFLEPLQSVGLHTAFVGRVKGVDVDTDRDATIARLVPYHKHKVEQLGFDWKSTWRAEQVHGAGVAVVRDLNATVVSGVDGLITNIPEAMLAIYVADCGAVYLMDPKHKAIGLVHSGKKGTELNIVKVALDKMAAEYGTDPTDVIAVLAPCIRPPAYDVDFAAGIRKSLEEIGVGEFHDSGICTSSDLDAYYSYRMEKGATGRMLALFGIEA